VTPSRLVTAPVATVGGPAAAPAWLPVLRRVLAGPPPAPVGTRCEFCGEPLASPDDGRGSGEHGHVLDVASRAIRCACPACRLLFTTAGAGGGTLRAVGDRWAFDAAFPLNAARWAALEVPVGLAFLLEDSRAGRSALSYPSPAGAADAAASPSRVREVWTAALRDAPGFPRPEPDIEAVVLRRTAVSLDEPGGLAAAAVAADDGCEAYLMPVDACYALVGRIRRDWSGFDGGPAARAAIEDALAAARRHAAGTTHGNASTAAVPGTAATAPRNNTCASGAAIAPPLDEGPTTEPSDDLPPVGDAADGASRTARRRAGRARAETERS
jgi:hypothetical protein